MPAPTGRGRAGHLSNKEPHAASQGQFRFVTFDCYGTLIDWETGALRRLPDGGRPRRLHGRPRRADAAVHSTSSARSRAGSYELYAEVLRRTAVRVGRGDGLGPRALALGLPARQRARAGTPFRETNAQLERFAKKFEIGHPLEHRRQAARRHPAPLPRSTSTSSSPPSRCAATSPTRPTSRSARAGSAARRAGCTSPRGYETDVEPVREAEGPGDLGEPPRAELEPGQKKPTEEVKTFRDAAKLLGAA